MFLIEAHHHILLAGLEKPGTQQYQWKYTEPVVRTASGGPQVVLGRMASPPSPRSSSSNLSVDELDNSIKEQVHAAVTRLVRM